MISVFHVGCQPHILVEWLPSCSREDLNSRNLPIRQCALPFPSPHVPSRWFSQNKTRPDGLRGEMTFWSQLGALENSPHLHRTIILQTECSNRNILMAINTWDALHHWGFLIVSHREIWYNSENQEHKDANLRNGFRQYLLALLQTSYLVIPWWSWKCRGECRRYCFMRNAPM